MKPSASLHCLGVLLALALCPANAEPEPQAKTWTDPDAARREDPDFLIQGEYGSANPGAAFGVQVVALGNGSFDAYLLQGGLPGLGWTPGKSRKLIQGTRNGNTVSFVSPDKSIAATIQNGKLLLTEKDGSKSALPRIERQSPTLGASPVEGAVVLFDGSSVDAWENGRIENGLLLASNSRTKQRFSDYKLHLEFRTPYKPMARSQKRGNSGIYHSGRWETQVLDSFGGDGRDNECGGIYSISKPLLNMCLPPLVWQTYDVDFTAAKFDAAGNRTAWPRITVKLNGVLIHKDLELSKDFTTSSPITGPLDNPEGPVFIQYHDNPVVFRNIWIVPGN